MAENRLASNNFRLNTTIFTSGGVMDESGKCQIVKRFLYEIVNNAPLNRQRALLDLETLVPIKGSCMSDDPRYTLKSAAWNCLDWRQESTLFYIDATYRRISDDDEASSPWNLAPFNVVTNAVEEEKPFLKAYNKKNKLEIPLVNTAADPIEATTKEVITQISFSFYAQDYDLENVQEFSNSVNRSSEHILGQRYKAGTLFLMPFQVSCLVSYEDDGYTEKWKYYQVDMSLRYREEGWQRELLNVGNRARFGEKTPPEVIYQYYKFLFLTRSFATVPVWTTAVDYHSHDAEYRIWYEKNAKESNLPVHVPYEFGENIPLDKNGAVNRTVLRTDITSEDYTGYPTRKFNEFKTLNWNSLGMPNEIKKKWRL